MIVLQGVTKVYRRGATSVYAVRGVTLTIPDNAFTIIMGPSGSGKSTLLYLIGCLDTPTEGQITLDGQDLSRLSSNERAEIRGKKMGFVFQDFRLISNLSALENVELPLLLRGTRRSHARVKARETLERMGLGERLDHRPTELSGGESQRVAIARALVNDPRVILADEPTGNLDSEAGARVFGLLRSLTEEGRQLIMVTHNPAFTAEADQVVYMVDGRPVKVDRPLQKEVIAS